MPGLCCVEVFRVDSLHKIMIFMVKFPDSQIMLFHHFEIFTVTLCCPTASTPTFYILFPIPRELFGSLKENGSYRLIYVNFRFLVGLLFGKD